MTTPEAKIARLRKQYGLPELQDMAEELTLPTTGTKLELATAIVERQTQIAASAPAETTTAEPSAAAPPPLPEGTRKAAMDAARGEAFPKPAVKPPTDDLEEGRRRAQEEEELARTKSDKPDPKAAADGTGDVEIPPVGRLRHTGRWLLKTSISYVNTRSRTVTRRETIFVTGHGWVPNIVNDIPPGVAKNLWQRGHVEPEMA